MQQSDRPGSTTFIVDQPPKPKEDPNNKLAHQFSGKNWSKSIIDKFGYYGVNFTDKQLQRLCDLAQSMANPRRGSTVSKVVTQPASDIFFDTVVQTAGVAMDSDSDSEGGGETGHLDDKDNEEAESGGNGEDSGDDEDDEWYALSLLLSLPLTYILPQITVPRLVCVLRLLHGYWLVLRARPAAPSRLIIPLLCRSDRTICYAVSPSPIFHMPV